MKEKTVSGLYSAYIMPIKAYERLSVFNFLIYKNIPELMIQQWNGEKKTFASLLLVQRNDSIENLDISSSYSLLQTVTKKKLINSTTLLKTWKIYTQFTKSPHSSHAQT